MKVAIRALFRDTVIYGLAGGAARFAKVLVVPIVASAFAAADYGAFDSLGVYAYLAAVIGLMGLDSAVILFARGQGEDRSDPAVITLGLVTVGVLGAVGATVLFVFRAPLGALLLDTTRYSSAIGWAAAGVVPSALLIYLLSILKWEFRRTAYLLASLGSASVSITLTWWVAFRTDLGVPGLFIAALLGQVLGVAIALVGARDLLVMRLRSGVGKRMLAVGLPFAVVGATAAFAPSVDRFVLARYHGLEAAGVYGVGQKIATLLALGLAGFQAAWGPFAFARKDAMDRHRVFARVLDLLILGAIAGVVALVIIAPWIARALGDGAYAGAARFVAPLALGSALGGVYFVVSIGAFFEARSALNLTAYLCGVGVMIVLNAIFVLSRAPAIGVAWANCAGQAAAVVAIGALSQRVHPLPFRFQRSTALFLGGAAVAAALGRFAPRLSGAQAALALSLTLGAALCWLFFGILSAGERRLLTRRWP